MASNKECRKIVVMNIPSSYDAELVKDYIEGTLDIDVMEVNIFPYIQGRALVTLKDDLKDLRDAAQLVANSPIEGNEVLLLETYRKPAIVVNELNIEMLSEEFLKMYLENTFADGDEVIENSQTWPEYHIAAVHFSSEHQHVVDDILVENDHTPLPSEDYHIKISHFYCNFHEFIGQQSYENTSVKNTQKAIVPPLGKNNNFNPTETKDSESDSSTEDNEEDCNVGDEDSKSEDDDDDDKSGSEGECNYTVKENDNSFGYKTKKTGVAGQNESDGTSMRGRHKKNEASQPVNAVPKYKDIQSLSDDDKEETIPKFQVIRGRGRGNIRCKSSGPVSKEILSRGGLPNQVNRSKAPVPSWRGGNAHIFRGGNTRNCRGLGQITNVDSNDWSKLSYNSNSGIDSNRNDTFTHSVPRGQWNHDDYGQPQSSPGVRNPTLQSWNSESDVGYNWNGSLFSSRGGTSGRGSAYVWRKSGMPTEKHIIRKTSLQEESFRDGGKEFLKRSHTVADDMSEASENSKTLLQRNQTKVFHSQSESFERDTEQLLKQKEEEKAKLQELSKNVRATMEMTVLQETFLNPLFRAFSDCTIYFDGNKKELVLFGTQSAITDCQMKLMLEMKKLKEDTIKMSSDMQSILSRDKGKQYLQDLNTSGLKGAMVQMDNDLLLIAAKEESILSEATKMLRTKLDVSETIKSEVKIPVDRLTNIKYAIEHSLLVSVSFNESEKTIQLTGVEDDVQMARRDVEELLEEFGVFEKSFNVGEPFARFFHLCLNERITFILKSVEVTDFISTETKNSIRFKGSKNETRLVLRNLEDLKNNVISKTWSLLNDFNFKTHEIFLIAKSFKTGQMKEKIETYKYKDKCLVTLKVPDFALQMISSKHKKPSGKAKLSKYRVSGPINSEPSRPSSQNKLVFDISNTCQLIIKPYGDITKEKSQVLVSVLGPDMDMRKTRVGGTFNKAFPSHWKELKGIQDSNPGAPVLTVPNPKGLKCLAVCHVVLAPWNPSTSLQQLSVAVQTVINQAKAIGAKSVSFPALGCGRAFQFPPSNVAQQVLSSIQAGNVGNFLTKVTLLAPDIELFKELKAATPQYFNATVPKSNLAIAPPVPTAQVFQNEESEDETGDSESSDDMLDSNSLIDSKNTSFAQITITTLHGVGNVESMKNTIAKEIRETCLHVDKFSQNLLDHWSKESLQKIMKEAIRLSVWVERSSHIKTKKVRFDLTGEKHAVIEMKSFIHQEYLEESSHLPKKRLTSDNMPRRGTVDFLRYAADSDELFPSYWSLNKSKSFLKSLGNTFQRKKCENLVSVDKDIKDAITKLVAQTIDLNLVGHGNDATGIQYQNLKVVDVKRVENPDQFELYRTQRKRLFEKMASRGHICQDIGKLPGSKGRVVTTELLSDSMKKELYYEINEHYLFHGTKSDTVEALIHNGLDPRLSNDAAMFGKGIYAAEKATKSDQYADSRAKREPNGTKLTLILTRMLLGDVFLCDDKHKSVQGKATKKLSRPPCIKCLEDICKCKNQTLFDSVMGDGKWLFREFVVYESARCYPEYIITYQRV